LFSGNLQLPLQLADQAIPEKNNKIQHPSSHEDQSSPNACDPLKFAARKKLRTELNLLQD
jgi:hypothetical protein